MVLLVLFAGAAQAAAPSAVVDVALSADNLTVGDRTEATLSLELPAGELAGEPRFPAWGKSWGEAEVLEAGAVTRTPTAGGRTVYRQRVVVAAFVPGKIPLPQVAVAVPYRNRTENVLTPPGLALGVRSVLPPAKEGEEPQPKPADPLRPLPVGAPFWWTLGILSLAVAALAWLVWRRKSQAAGAADVPLLPALPELQQALDRLSGAAPVALHTGLSLALRRYLGRALAFAAVESTTGEIRRHLHARRLPGRLSQSTVELLYSCDLVKFAKHEESGERGAERLATARRLGAEIDAWMRPAVPEPQPAALEAAG